MLDAAGPWDTRMLSDDDGEYFCRVLMKSEGTHLFPKQGCTTAAMVIQLSLHWSLEQETDALWLSMQLHIRYMLTMEDSARSREACLNYLQRNLIIFCPDRTDIIREIEEAAVDLGGKLHPPHLTWKYSWIKKMFGFGAAKDASLLLRRLRWNSQRELDRLLFHSRMEWVWWRGLEKARN